MTASTLSPEVLSGLRERLEPCPFCGGAVELTSSKTLGDRLFCIKCPDDSPCVGSGLGIYVVAGQVETAIAAWNRRAAIDLSPPVVEEGAALTEAARRAANAPTAAEASAIAAAALAASQAEASRMREALRPFAEYMGDMDRDNLGNPLPDDAGVGWVYLTQGDFRRAKDALSSGSKT